MSWLDGYDEQRDAAYRAIGHYVVQFSELVRLMREMVCEYAAKGVVDIHISTMLLGEATPQIIANAFFGMCRTMGELEDDEQKIASWLQKTVKKAIEGRNDIAHGDWSIGNVSLDEAGELRIHPPQIVRVIPARSEGPWKVLDLSASGIEALTARIDELLPLIEDFGHLALKLPLFAHDRDEENPRISRGDYRVRDVLVLSGGKRDLPSRVKHSGPHASTVFGGGYAELAYAQPSPPDSSRDSISE